GVKSDNIKIISGGGIRGIELNNPDAPIMKTTSAILALTPSNSSFSDKKCGLCRKCIRKCPMKINPKLLSSTTNIDKASENFILDCTECNLCSYICKKNRNPMKNILDLKKLIQ
ncbi:MAG: 4Fe-4S dicluster domain-containing protein, partial [Clostridia bacterium]